MMKEHTTTTVNPGSPTSGQSNPGTGQACTSGSVPTPEDKDNTKPPPPRPETNGANEAHPSEAAPENKTSDPPDSERTWRHLGELKKAPPDSDTELIKPRYLCVSGGLLLIGPSGIGKSSLVVQLVTAFSLGLPSLGFTPVRPLKILIIQAENDETDLADMRDGVFAGMSLTAQQIEEAGKKIVVVTEDTMRGGKLCSERIGPLLEEHTPDLLVIDPTFAYIDGDTISARDVGIFLRSQLNPLIRKYQCGLILVHHTNKPGKESSSKNPGFDHSYLGSGSADFTNWARAVVVLQKVRDQQFDLWASKRGHRLQWKSSHGETVIVKRIAHCKTPGRIWWEEMTEQEVAAQRASEESSANGQKSVKKTVAAAPTTKDLLALIPATGAIAKLVLIRKAEEAMIKPYRTRAMIQELVQSNRIKEFDRKRDGKRPEVMIERVEGTPQA